MILIHRQPRRRVAIAGAALSLAAALGPAPARADQAPAAAAAAVPSEDAITEELIRRLQRHNALSKQDAEDLVRMVQQRKAAAAAPAAAAAGAVPAAAAAPPPAEGDVRVLYLPEGQKKRMEETVRQEVLQDVLARNWTDRYALPDWLNHIRFSGDFRFRNEWQFYGGSNWPTFYDYNALNSNPPFDVNFPLSRTTFTPPPTIDSTQDRERPRLRGRLAMDATLDEGLFVRFRLATGNLNYPVTSDQTLGSEGSNSAGDFNKIAVYFDQMYLNYQPTKGVSLWVGRFPSPWLAPTNLVWYQDLAFDGAAAQFRFLDGGPVTPFLTLGAFSVENTALAFPSTDDQAKVASRDKWLYGGQLGADLRITPELSARNAFAYYYFAHLQGELSSPCLALDANDACNSDDSRPGFVQKGNTLFYIRNLLPFPNSANPADDPQYQYFGLASPFRELDFSTEWDLHVRGPLHLVFGGEAVANFGYNYTRVSRLHPQNNFNVCVTNGPAAGSCSGYDTGAGNIGWQAQLRFGYPDIHKRLEWYVVGGYRYLETDAVVDAFTDSDFHLGGTNAKGYYLHGFVGFAHNAWIGAKWFSATEVSGPPLAIDVLQFDINAAF